MAELRKVVIVGSGPAGYTAAIYAARANLNPLMISGIEKGGQLTTTTDVENYPGFPESITGPQLMEDMEKQARRFDTEIITENVDKIDFSKRPYHLVTSGGKEFEAEALILATGATAKYLGLESENKFKNMGVSACATCDGFFYRNREVAVVGGGDTAAEEATYLTNFCTKVYLVHRRDELRASKAMQKRVFENEKIELVWNHEVNEVLGDDSGVTGLELKNTQDASLKKIDVHGMFVAIGHKPNTELFQGVIDLDDQGYIQAKPGSSYTNVEGVFACGDVMDKVYRQAITAAGTGCMAAIDAERWLAEKG